MIPRSLLVPLQIECDFYQIDFDLSEKDSVVSKLPLRIIVVDCKNKQPHVPYGQRMGEVFKVNGKLFGRLMCAEFELQPAISNSGNFKWPEDADGTKIHCASDFGLYLVSRGWYRLDSDEVHASNGTLEFQTIRLSKIQDDEQHQIAVISGALSQKIKRLNLKL